jgi:hypothetical protein
MPDYGVLPVNNPVKVQLPYVSKLTGTEEATGGQQQDQPSPGKGSIAWRG